jgi:hypothetical protein
LAIKSGSAMVSISPSATASGAVTIRASPQAGGTMNAQANISASAVPFPVRPIAMVIPLCDSSRVSLYMFATIIMA